MIVRIWHGRTSASNAASYARHARETVFPALARIDGFRGAMLLRRDKVDETEFVVQTVWNSMDAVRKFAGDQVDLAVVEPAARRVLSTFDEFVRHYELAESEGDCRCCEPRSGDR